LKKKKTFKIIFFLFFLAAFTVGLFFFWQKKLNQKKVEKDTIAPKEQTENIEEKVFTQLKLRLFDPEQVELINLRQLKVTFKDGSGALFSPQKKLEIQLDSLQLIFSRAKIEDRKIKSLDLRFDKPVVVYE